MNNKKAPLLLSFLFLFLVEISWSQLKQIPVGATQTLTSVTLLNNDTVTVTGIDGVYRSNNKGVTWSKLYTSSENSYFSDLHFIDGDNGMAVGPILGGNSYAVAKTTNGGVTWTNTAIDNTLTAPRNYNDIEFVGKSAGVAVGTNGKIIVTSDGGASWSAGTNSNTANLLKVEMNAATNGFILAPNYVARFNGTAAGNAVVLNTTADFLDLADIDGQYIYALTPNRLYKSGNSGTTWQRLDLPFLGATCLYAHNQDTLFVGSGNGLYITTNMGTSWAKFKETENISVTDVVADQDGHLFLTALDGVMMAGPDFGGPPAPLLRFFLELQEECGYTSLLLNNESDEALTFKWVYNGEVVSESYIDTIRFTEDATGTIYLVGSNGVNSDTLSADFDVVVSSTAADAGPDVYACFNEPVQLRATGGVSYSWTPAETLDQPGEAEPVSVFGTGTIEYVVAVDNGLNCITYDTVRVIRGDQITPFDWQEVFVTTSFPVKTVQMISPTLGYAVSPNVLLVTHDGGTTWETDTRFFDPESTNSTVTSDLEVLGTDTLLVLNDNLFRSADSGDTYEMVSGNMLDIEFVSRSYGFGISYVGAEQSQIVRTVDGGQTWNAVSGVFNGWLYKLDCEDATACVAVGGSTGGEVPLMVYTQDGTLWKEGIVIDVAGPVTDVQFMGSETAIAAGRGGQVLMSINGGEAWYVSYTMSSLEDLSCVKMVTPQRGFIGGKNGNLYQTSNGGECWQPMGAISESTINGIYANDTVAFISTASLYDAEGRIFRADLRAELSFTLSAPAVCVSDDVIFTNTSVGLSSYSLRVDGQEVPFGDEVTLSFDEAGKKEVTLQGTTTGGVVVTSTRIITVSGGTVKPVISETLYTLGTSYDAVHEWYLDNILLAEKAAIITPTVSGLYQVRVLEDNCPSQFSEIVSFTFKKLSMTGSSVSCAKETLTQVNASEGFDSYEWKWNGVSAGSALEFANAEERPGTYTLTLIGKAGDLTDQIEKEVTIHDVPADALVNLGIDRTIESGSTITLQTPGEFAAYRWSNGLTTRSITLSSDDLPEGQNTFSVEVMDLNGCRNSDEIVITNVVVTGIEQDVAGQLEVFPNPVLNGTILRVRVPGKTGIAAVRVWSANGINVKEVKISLDSHGEAELSVDELATGIYVVQCRVGSEQYISRLGIM